MGYPNLQRCLEDLNRIGELAIIDEEVDPHLELAAIQRRVYERGGPALYFTRIRGCSFPAVSNLFGTLDRAHFIFRDTLEPVRRIIRLRADPAELLKNLSRLPGTALGALNALPRRVNDGPVLDGRTTITNLPRIVSWPGDGGAFITLPQVYSEDPENPGVRSSNLGMYRIQLSGNLYRQDQQVGLHYQIHRGLGIHHARALARGEKLPVSIFVGGPPAHTFAAVMPLPEAMPEIFFAGVLAGRRFRYTRRGENLISVDADFCITGTLENRPLPEGPFGDHLGYYSLQHPFPVLRVKEVYHRRGAIWPFTVVGRPPQEDTVFGKLIHELTGPMVPASLPGLKALHAVDAAGVHPLLLAIGSERYVPYEKRRPRELMTIACSILGFGQASLAKYLCIVAGEDAPGLDIHDLPAFFGHLLERVDWSVDLHFLTATTMDTLDYSGSGLNSGSKVIITAAGESRRKLAHRLPVDVRLPKDFSRMQLVLPGIVLVEGLPYQDPKRGLHAIRRFISFLKGATAKWKNSPLFVLVDGGEFESFSLNDFLWVTFTRSDPAADIHGVDSFSTNKHWGCRGPLIIDARRKPHHAPPLIEDPEVTARVERLGKRGGSLEGIL